MYANAGLAGGRITCSSAVGHSLEWQRVGAAGLIDMGAAKNSLNALGVIGASSVVKCRTALSGVLDPRVGTLNGSSGMEKEAPDVRGTTPRNWVRVKALLLWRYTSSVQGLRTWERRKVTTWA